MSATDELRRLLDERGVEWWQSANTLGCIFTRWYSPLFGDEVVAMENGEEGLVLFDHFMTPEQAIEATLGRGECEKLPSDGITRCFVRRYGYEREFGYWKCSACGCECFEGARYCMGCGRKVVDA